MKRMLTITAGLLIACSTSLMASEGATLYAKCVGWHGVNGEKQALGKSQVIQGWKVEKTIAALQGYKDGTYGGAMKGVMKGQAMSLTDVQIKKIAEHIASK